MTPGPGDPRPGPGRGRAAVALVAWVGLLGAAVVGLHGVGGPLAPPPLGDPGGLGAWLDGRRPAEAAVAVVRLVALGLAWYLLAVAVAGTVVRGLRLASLVRAADTVTIPAVRRLVNGALGASLAAAALTGAAGAAVAADGRPPAGVVAAEAVPRPPDEAPAGPPPTMRRLPDQPGGHQPSGAAPAAGPAAGLATGDGPRSWQVRPGEHFWSVAEQVLAASWSRPAADHEVDPYWRALVEANRAGLRDPANPDLVFPGQELVVPPPPPPPPS